MARTDIQTRTRFVKVKCRDCENVQIIFDRCSSAISCLVCGATLAKPTGGKTDIKGEVVEVLG
jgi:small subunit ribosomal protein S27e